jgi:predicted phage terminase large subunit-like protein
MDIIVKKTLDDWLNHVNYDSLELNYQPSKFALKFINFIKLANISAPEENKSPLFHLRMLDDAGSAYSYILHLCFRGSGKTTLAEYLQFYIAIFQELGDFGSLNSMIYVSDSIDNGVKTMRESIEARYEKSTFLQEYIPQTRFTDKYIEYENNLGEPFGMKLYGAQTGVRGTKIFAKRPKLAILDDLIQKDEDAKSKIVMDKIKNTIQKDIKPALHPSHKKVIFQGTPFNKQDPIIEAIESGAWRVNVWPLAEKFPCSEQEFKGAWPDRFTYASTKIEYDMYKKEHHLAAFQQEYLLRITSPENKLVQDSEIQWYNRKQLLNNKHNFNFYITTDFATTDKTTSDYNVISVWAYNSNGDWYWVDGICKRQTMDITTDDLFRLVLKYKPQSVGVETSGQQKGFIDFFKREMMNKNIWFNFARHNKKEGIYPSNDKLSRFNLIVPLFSAGKIYWPEEMKETPIMEEFINEISLATIDGLKGKDDCLDTISMLAYMNPWKPSDQGSFETNSKSNKINTDNIWEHDIIEENDSHLSSYLV